MWHSVVCAIFAAINLQALNPFRTGKIVLYQVTYSRVWHRFEIVPFMTLGILGGLYGAFLIRFNMRIAKWRRSRRFAFPVLEVAIVSFLTALINFPNVFMRQKKSELLHSLFSECAPGFDDQLGLCKTSGASLGKIALLLVAAVLAFFLTSITFGLDIPAGIIIPSVTIGALYGRALGMVVKMWQQAYPGLFLFSSCEPDTPCVTPGTYAIIGAASALGGATRMTASIVVIMFELTGALVYVIPIMIGVMLSKWCGDMFGKRGIYESWIYLKEYPFLDLRDDITPPDVSANKVMTAVDDMVVISAVGHTVNTLRNLLAVCPYRGFPVVNDTLNPVLLGYVSRNELSYALRSSTYRANEELAGEAQVHFVQQPFADSTEVVDFRHLMDQTPITLHSDVNFLIVLRMFQRLGLHYVLFTKKGILQGLLTKKDVWLILNDVENHKDEGLEEDEVFREANAAEEVGLLDSDDANSRASLERERQWSF